MNKSFVSVEETQRNLKHAYQIAAQVVALYGDAYLPIFKRLHEELQRSDADLVLRSITLKAAENGLN